MPVFRFGIVTVVLMLVGAAPVAAEDERNILEEKVVVVYRKSDPKTGAVLERAVVRNLGDHYFLVGSIVDLGDPTVAGMVQWIPVDDIGRINQFNDVTELRTRTRTQ